MVSIIIVNYKVERELISCIASIINSKPKVKFEIIVVDNSSSDELKKKLSNIPQTKYVRSKRNIGFGAGNNLGAKIASGKYLFFLNPDTIVKKDTIDILYNFVEDNKETGMVAPLLLDESGKAHLLQGSDQYNLTSAIITSSFLNRIIPNNQVSRKFFHKNWDRKSSEEFDVVPGTAFMISKDLFEKAGMFDEELFLYFEEYDLAKRVNAKGYKNYIVPKAKITHTWEASTKKRQDIDRIFSESRNYFFKKHYGAIFALIINFISNFGKYEFMLGLVLLVSVFLSLFKIRELMTFIGDQGWFYLSARDMLTNSQIPLVGIASSHPWLHQGPLWTYMLALFLWLFKFDPVSGAYLTVILGALSVLGIYTVGFVLFSKRVGLIASLLYATSPLAVYYMRFPYHTSPIPLFVITLIFSLHKLIKGKAWYLPLSILLLAILYNFEIATVTLWGALAAVLIYIFLKKRNIFKQIFSKKNIIFIFFSLTIPLLPILLYDVKNGFPQTAKFGAWIIYRMVFLFSGGQQGIAMDKIFMMFNFLFINFTRLIFAQNAIISFVILVLLIGWLICRLLSKKSDSYNLIFLSILVPIIFIILNQTPSDAYLPIFFPTIILLFSTFLNFIMSKKLMFVPVLVFIIILITGNITFMLKSGFVFDESSKLFVLNKRIRTANQILNMVGNKDYNLKGKGPGSEFESFTMNYEYLTWWLGHGPSKRTQSLKVYISESVSGIKIE